MKELFRYLKDYKKEAILGPAFKLLEAGFELFVPLVIAAIIDSGINKQDKGFVYSRCAILVLLGLIGLAASVTAQYFAAKAAVGAATSMRNRLFSHLQTLSYSQIDNLGTSTMITRMTSDINQIQSGINLTLRLLLRSPFVVFGAMIMAFTINAEISLIFLITIVILSIVVFGIMLISMPLYKKVQVFLDKVVVLTRENLTGVRVIRAFNKEANEKEKFFKRNRELTHANLFVGRISALLNPLTYVIINVAIVILINEGAIKVDSGILTQGMVIALYNYMSQILVELIKLANLCINISKALACNQRVQNVFDSYSSSEESVLIGCNDGHKTFTNPIALEFKDVALKYEGAGDYTLNGITFALEKGKTLGIIGGTGSGKSSIANLIPGFYYKTSGSVLVDGVETSDMKPEELRACVGIVPQKAVLFKGTIRENMQWGNENASDEMINRAIKIACADEVIAGKEKGLDYELNQGGKNLSGGQRQRLTIARALVKNPEILILDDSSSALDYATDARLRENLQALSGMTKVIISQRSTSVMKADKILVLDDGKMVGIGTHEELLKNCDIYKEIHYSSISRDMKGGTNE